MERLRNNPLYVIVAAVVVLLIAYGISRLAATPDDVATVEPAKAEDNGKGISKDKLKIGVLYISDPTKERSGYSYTHDIGIQEMQRNLGLSDEQIVRKVNVSDSDKAQTMAAIEECIAQGCNIIFTTSFGYMDATAEEAKMHPNVNFFHGTGFKSNNKNFNNYFGRIYQPRYLSGLVAGLKTKTGRIGYVAAMGSENSEVTGGIDAFAMGVHAVNPAARIYVKVTNSWFDPDKEKAAAEELLDMGCDVLSQHCDTEYPLELAEKHGVWGIGYNSDMRKQTPKAALASVIWHWGAFYTDVVQQLMDGTWQPHNYYEGMSEGLVGLTELSDENDAKVKEVVSSAEADILSGKQKVFTGEIPTNDGGSVGVAGVDFSDEEITGNIHWYYQNVEIVP